jgi:hypothetical protein
MTFVFPSSGRGKPESVTNLFLGNPGTVRVERESGGEGWVTIVGAHGWLHGDQRAAIIDARELAGLRSSAGGIAP